MKTNVISSYLPSLMNLHPLTPHTLPHHHHHTHTPVLHYDKLVFAGESHEFSGSVCCEVVYNISVCLEQADEGANAVSKMGVGAWSRRDAMMTEKKRRGWRRRREEGGGMEEEEGGGRREERGGGRRKGRRWEE